MRKKGARTRETRRRRRWWAGVGLACLGLAATVWICADYLFGPAVQKMLTGHDPAQVQVITVPDFVGQLFTDGQTADPALYDVTVTYIYTPAGATEQKHASAAPREILNQDPPPRAKRKVIPGRQRCALRLTVCLGEQQLTLPDVCGTEGRKAKIALLEMGFSPTVIYCEPSPAMAKEGRGGRGQVLYTDPPAGTQLLAGAPVKVYVAEEGGSASVVCPDLHGMTLPEAAAALERAGLQLGTQTERQVDAEAPGGSAWQSFPEVPPDAPSDDLPEAPLGALQNTPGEAYVCAQGLCPGTWVLAGSRVDVTLAQPVEKDTEPPASRWPWFPWW